MNDETWKTLFHPFERGLIALPDMRQHWIFSGAQPGFVLPDGFEARLSCVQPWRPAYLALEREGYYARYDMPAHEKHDGALVLLGRYRQDNHLRLREAALTIKSGGTIVVAGGKTDGIDPLRKHLRKSLPGLESVSKHHGLALWFEVPESGLADALPRSADPVRSGGMTIPPGIFSSDGPDPASVMLAEFFKGRLSGAVADLGAGWGYLGGQALKHCPGITGLHCYEADWRAREACWSNLSSRVKRDFAARWCDVLSEEIRDVYDCVIMNPPFHEGRATQPKIGVGFIEAAAGILNPGGRLLMVANRNLPYEEALTGNFKAVETLKEANGFKVFEAVRQKSARRTGRYPLQHPRSV